MFTNKRSLLVKKQKVKESLVKWLTVPKIDTEKFNFLTLRKIKTYQKYYFHGFLLGVGLILKYGQQKLQGHYPQMILVLAKLQHPL